MKKLYTVAAIGLMLSLSFYTSAQGYYVKQIITGNSGKFEFTPPFEDYVILQNYDPVTQSGLLFGTIFTQSIQDILIAEPFAYISAQDSIVKYNLNSLERVSAVADSGINKLSICHGRLVISKQYPVTKCFATVRDTSDLSLVSNIEGITGDAAGMVTTNDTLYVAVNEGWMGSDGKLAVIDPNTWTLVRQIELGNDAVGIYNLYLYNGQLISVNKTPYGVTDQGSLTVYDPITGNVQNYLYGVTVGNGCGLNDSLLYFLINNGIGSVDLNTMLIADSSIINDPGSSLFTYITSAAFDTINDRFYVNIGNYITPGICLVASATGDSITSYATGISTEAVAIDYREMMTGFEGQIPSISNTVTLYPNPATDHLNIQFREFHEAKSLLITDLYGKILVYRTCDVQDNTSVRLDIGMLPSGMYFLVVENTKEKTVGRFIKL